MTKLVVASLFALTLTTGFTCAKNAPEQTAQPAAAPAEQAQMAAPGETSTPVSGDATAAAAPAAPATTSAPTETK